MQYILSFILCRNTTFNVRLLFSFVAIIIAVSWVNDESFPVFVQSFSIHTTTTTTKTTTLFGLQQRSSYSCMNHHHRHYQSRIVQRSSINDCRYQQQHNKQNYQNKLLFTLRMINQKNSYNNNQVNDDIKTTTGIKTTTTSTVKPAEDSQQQQQQQFDSTSPITSTSTTSNSNSNESLSSSPLSLSYSLDPIRTVAVVGGTHGNEYTGVWIVRDLIKQQQQLETQSQQSLVTTTTTTQLYGQSYSSIKNVTCIIGNPIAHEQNRRFMDIDLNRQFSMETLQYVSSSQQQIEKDVQGKQEYDNMNVNLTPSLLIQQQPYNNNNNHIHDDNNAHNIHQQEQQPKICMEMKRAYELNQLLGPKTFQPNDRIVDVATGKENNENMDLIIDLHSTTANMGVTLIVPEGDILMIQAAAYVMYKCNHHHQNNDKNNNEQQQQQPYVAATTQTATPTTTCTSPFVSRILIDHVRSCHSSRPFLPSMGKHEFTIEVGPVPQGVLRHDSILQTQMAIQYLFDFLELYNNNENNVDTSTITINNNKIDNNNHDHDNNLNNNSVISHMLRSMYPTFQVPCYTDLGKIPWPSHPENPNFPLYVVHQSIQDRDFHPISVGDPLFVTFDNEIIRYDGSYGSTVHLAFINEGGYYYSSSGTGVCALKDGYCSLHDGIVLNL